MPSKFEKIYHEAGKLLAKLPIFIPFSPFESKTCGGPATFMGNLRRHLDSVGHSYIGSETPDGKCDIFFPVRYDTRYLDKVKKSGGRIVQRLDGVHYPTAHPDYRERNAEIELIYKYYSDFVVFQSEYSRRQCFAMFGYIPPERYTIIRNGADRSVFFPNLSLEPPEIESSSHGTGSSSSQLQTPASRSLPGSGKVINLLCAPGFRFALLAGPAVEAVEVLRARHGWARNIVLHLAGPIPENPAENPAIGKEFAVCHGDLPREEMAELFRKCHQYVYTHLNPPCPNSVIEAASCGLPVAGFDSGAMMELVGFSPELLCPVSGDLFQRSEDIDVNALADRIEFGLVQYSEFRKRALDHSADFAFKDCAAKYLDVMARVFDPVLPSRPLPFGQSNAGRGIQAVISKISGIFWVQQLVSKILSFVPQNSFAAVFEKVLIARGGRQSPLERARELFGLQSSLYSMQGAAAVSYGSGRHTKHGHTGYHRFFTDRVPDGDRVLDIGCGNGELAAAVAAALPGCVVRGIDMAAQRIMRANRDFAGRNLDFVIADAFDLPGGKWNTVMLSNVLEHIPDRVRLLKRISERANPDRILIRVPCFDRDWRVPLAREVGVDWRLDDTHETEYTEKAFRNEMAMAGLRVGHLQVNWGEIWAEVTI